MNNRVTTTVAAAIAITVLSGGNVYASEDNGNIAELTGECENFFLTVEHDGDHERLFSIDDGDSWQHVSPDDFQEYIVDDTNVELVYWESDDHPEVTNDGEKINVIIMDNTIECDSNNESESENNSEGNQNQDVIPVTGIAVTGMVAIGILVLGGGGVVFYITRQRR